MARGTRSEIQTNKITRQKIVKRTQAVGANGNRRRIVDLVERWSRLYTLGGTDRRLATLHFLLAMHIILLHHIGKIAQVRPNHNQSLERLLLSVFELCFCLALGLVGRA